jgi:hypothetical protein
MGATKAETHIMKLYSVGIVGETNYQTEISRTSPGERAWICFEEGNPYDSQALRVENACGKTIGYIARSSWLRDAIFDQGRGVTATIKDIARAPGGALGVVLDVTLTDDDLPHRTYGRSGPSQRTTLPAPATSAPTKAAAPDHLAMIISAMIIPITCECGAIYNLPLGGITSDSAIDCPSCKVTRAMPVEALATLHAEFCRSSRELLAKYNAPILTDAELIERLEGAARIRPTLVAPIRQPKPSLWKRFFG